MDEVNAKYISSFLRDPEQMERRTDDYRGAAALIKYGITRSFDTLDHYARINHPQDPVEACRKLLRHIEKAWLWLERCNDSRDNVDTVDTWLSYLTKVAQEIIPVQTGKFDNVLIVLNDPVVPIGIPFLLMLRKENKISKLAYYEQLLRHPSVMQSGHAQEKYLNEPITAGDLIRLNSSILCSKWGGKQTPPYSFVSTIATLIYLYEGPAEILITSWGALEWNKRTLERDKDMATWGEKMRELSKDMITWSEEVLEWTKNALEWNKDSLDGLGFYVAWSLACTRKDLKIPKVDENLARVIAIADKAIQEQDYSGNLVNAIGSMVFCWMSKHKDLQGPFKINIPEVIAESLLWKSYHQ